MSLKLYYVPGVCSLSPHIALEESGLPYSAVLMDPKTHKLADGTDYYSINPLGYVPLLELADGSRLREGPAIVQYIADQAPQKNLAPANGTLARYHLIEWLAFMSSELHKGFSPLFNPDASDAFKAAAKARLLGRFQWVDGELKGRSNYLMGEHFTVADAYLFTICNWPARVGLDISGLANLAALRERIAQRPAMQAVLKAEGLV
ncbi:MAG: glutathione transferase GstA [Azonexus sp.]|jgi:glutathione S-transferase|nr:glutathione transferase GstA [Azonexus sp.]